jgi:hypothetical protein
MTDLSARDRAYLDQYYQPVTLYASQYRVSPILVLGLGAESGFASDGTYLRTGDAFGLTGGSTAHMTKAQSPYDNVAKLFALYGKQISGLDDNVDAFINALEGENIRGASITGWRVYNSQHGPEWQKLIRQGIQQMQRDVPIYRKLGGLPW